MNISVVIPVYNAEKFLKKAVQSALQFKEVKEVILIEDQSPDNALEVCKLLEKKESRVQLFQHPDKKNHGAGASRNLGIKKATQEYIAFLDADDYYLPNRFDAEKELFKNPNVEGVYGAIGVEYYTEKAKIQYYSIYKDNLTTVYKKHPPEVVFPGQLYLKGSFGLIHLDALTLDRKKLLKQTPTLFNDSLRLHQDSEFTLRISFYLNLYAGIIDKPIAIRGVHENNRITKVDSKEKKPATTRVLLWQALDNWSKNEPKLSEYYKNHIHRMYKSFELANTSSFKKYFKFLNYIFTDFTLVKNGLYNINYREVLFPFLKSLK